MTTLTFFTSASGFHRNFVCPYAIFVLSHNAGVFVEIAVDNLRSFEEENSATLDYVEKNWPGQFFLREEIFQDYPPAMRRFLIEPSRRRDYVYIGDVDIFVLEDIRPFHLATMNRLGLHHSNVVRPKSRRLTGLHFSQWELMYPVRPPRIRPFGLNRSSADERHLYERVRSKSELPPRGHQARPIHGFHMSPHRIPYSSEGWELDNSELVDKFHEFWESEVFQGYLDVARPQERWLLGMLRSTLLAQKVWSVPELGNLDILSFEKYRSVRRAKKFALFLPPARW